MLFPSILFLLVLVPLAYVSWSDATEPVPCTVEAHPVTGVYNGKLGLWLFLASELMLFGALFSAYVLLRVGAAPGTWPVGSSLLSVPIGTVNTLVLIGSSVTMVLAWAELKGGSFERGRRFLLLTAALATVFLAIKGYEYGTKLEHHLLPATSTYLALYWTLTGLHGLHVVGGIAVIVYLALAGRGMWLGAPARYTNRVECVGLYWHFVDVVRIFLFPTLYLL